MNDQTKEAVELLLSNRLFLYSLMHKPPVPLQPDAQIVRPGTG